MATKYKALDVKNDVLSIIGPALELSNEPVLDDNLEDKLISLYVG